MYEVINRETAEVVKMFVTCKDAEKWVYANGGLEKFLITEW